MKLQLKCLDQFLVDGDVTVQSFPLVIGRSPEADITLTNIFASRRHCEIDVFEGIPVLRDLSSSNGTLLNGCEINDEVTLEPGDIVAVGMTQFQVEFEMKKEFSSSSVSPQDYDDCQSLNRDRPEFPTENDDSDEFVSLGQKMANSLEGYRSLPIPDHFSASTPSHASLLSVPH